MAQIELRHATIRLIDGYSNTAAVNGVPVNGDTVMLIDVLGTSGKISLGTRFTVAGNGGRKHYVTAKNDNEFQRITVGAASAGHFTLGFVGTVAAPISVQTTTNLLWNDSAANVQAALEATAALVPGDVNVTLVSPGTWDIEFRQNYAGVDIGALVFVNVDLVGASGTAVTQTYQGGVTHQLTFTPSFATADGIPADDAVITFAGRTLTIKIGTGNVTYDEQRQMQYTLDRGSLSTVREGDDVPMPVVLDFIWEFITAASADTTPTIEDAFKQRGLAASWTTSSIDVCEPYAIDIEIEHVPPCNNQQVERLLFPDFRWESLNHDLRAAVVAVTGKCNAKQAIVSRSAA